MTTKTYPQKRKISGKRVTAGIAILLAAVLITLAAAYFLSRWLNFAIEQQGNLVSADGIYSYAALLFSRETNQALTRKNVNQPVFPASLTKIMTVYLAAEQLGPPAKDFVGGNLSPAL